MVEAVTPISSPAASSPTRIGTSTSISSEPDNAWVAARQSQITADQAVLRERGDTDRGGDDIGGNEADAAAASPDERHAHRPRRVETDDDSPAGDEPAESSLLSGESERIGTRNFDEDTPFGTRVTIL